MERPPAPPKPGWRPPGLLHLGRVLGIGQKREVLGPGALHSGHAGDFQFPVAFQAAPQPFGNFAKFTDLQRTAIPLPAAPSGRNIPPVFGSIGLCDTPVGYFCCLCCRPSPWPLNSQAVSPVPWSIFRRRGARREVELYLAGGARPQLTTKTSTDGSYNFIAVRPAYYDLTVEAAGFVKTTLRGISVDPARETSVPQVRFSCPPSPRPWMSPPRFRAWTPPAPKSRIP